MLKLSSQIHTFSFEFPFRTAHGIKNQQDALLVSLGMAHWLGYGECTSIPYYNVEVNNLNDKLQHASRVIHTYAYNGPERFWHFLHHLFPGGNFLIAALDIASWDLFAKMKNVPLHRIVGLQWKNLKPTCYTIGIQKKEDIANIVQYRKSPIYKLKVNGMDDLENVALLRSLSDAEIWIDANASWNVADAKDIVKELKSFNVTLIEQPFAVGSDEAVLELKSYNDYVNFIADESCKDMNDLVNVQDYYDGFNIKLSKCAGITPALQMMQHIKKQGKKIMLGSMCESQAGANALAHLIPIADFVDIDGPLLLNNNNPTLSYSDGMIALWSNLGLGYTPQHLAL